MIAIMHPAPYRSRIPVPLPRPPADRIFSAPSKLEELKIRYRQQLRIEKEAKLSELSQQNRLPSSGKRKESGRSNLVRDFFKERRHLSDTGCVPDIKQHYAQKKREVTDNTYHSKNVRPPVYKKNSAGRDKGNPLLPINNNTQRKGVNIYSTYTINSSPARRANSATSPESPVVNDSPTPKPPPFDKKAKIAHPYRKTPQKTPLDDNDQVSSDLECQTNSVQHAKVIKSGLQKQRHLSDSDDECTQPIPPKKNKQISYSKWKEESKQNNPETPKKLTDFQKWQLDQNKTKDERLKKFRERQRLASETEYGYLVDDGDDDESPDSRESPSKTSARLTRRTPVTQRENSSRMCRTDSQQSSKSNHRPESGRVSEGRIDEIEAELKRKEQALMEMIKKQQAELVQLKTEQDESDEQERLEEEKRRKRVAEQKERQKRLQDTRERARRQSESESPQRENSYVDDSKKNRRPVSRKNYTPKKPHSAKKKVSYKPSTVISEPNENTEFYINVIAADPDAQQSDIHLVRCENCGRKFAEERISKHSKICSKPQKTRKVLDPSKMRVAGTDMAKYVDSSKASGGQRKPKKNNWRKKHEDFLKTIEYARKVTQAEAEGTSLANLPPPPASENPDYVPCPHCQRRFNPTTAERHIPKCKDIKSRPCPPKNKKGNHRY